MKQTAVEWLFNEIDMQYPEINLRRKEWIIDKAKEMEKEQIKESWIEGGGCSHLSKENDRILAEQYYNETYKQL
jgi:hypothetical protein